LLIPVILNIETADIVTILGNLLDNAVDVVAKTENKMINLDIEYNRGSLFIQINNTFDSVVKYDNEHIVTLKDSDEHGYGLKNIKRSVEKYNGYVDISHKENIFSVAIILYEPVLIFV
jgi:sensor histidine kinase regulating citrate/malate metabolism